MRTAPVALAATLAVGLAACSGKDGPVESTDLCPASSETTTPTRVDLAVGESRQLLDAASSQCVLLTGGSRYLITVGNAQVPNQQENITQTAGFQLVGASGGAAASVADPAVVSPSAAELFGGSADASLELATARRRYAGHLKMLELNERLMRGMPSPSAAWAAERARRKSLGVSLAVGGVGSVNEVRILDRDNVGGNLCSNVNYLQIGARTVYVGTRSIVLEDTLSPLARQMDTAYVRLAREFDDTMFPILEQYYGNPLAYDAQLDNNGKVVMVFSPKINAFGDISGFVLNCDLFPQTEAGVSNEGEFFYALVPDSLGGGIRNWDRGIRATLIHEVKHVTANAEHAARNQTGEVRWLEEATAVHAEEIWARTLFGNTWKGNATYQQTLFCEVRPTSATNLQCRGKPFVMYSNFTLLYDYLAENEKYTPLGPINDSDFAFYGAGWNLVRWAADNYAATEPAFFKAITTAPSTERGVANLAARTGRTWPEMLADWSVAVSTDDRSGVAPARSELTIPSWNTRDIFAGMHGDFATNYPRTFPLQPRAISFGPFTQTVSSLRAGSFAAFELSGDAASQVLELRSANGTAAAPTTLVMNILRIQ